MMWKPIQLLMLAALLGGLAVPPAAPASSYVRTQVGTIQSTDFLKHTVTIDGRSYVVTDATTYGGRMSFSLLHRGMKVQYFLTGGTAGGTQTIVRIIVLPS